MITQLIRPYAVTPAPAPSPGTPPSRAGQTFAAFMRRARAAGELVVQPRMGVADPALMRAGLLATKHAGPATAGTVTLDSFTRVGDHAAARHAVAVAAAAGLDATEDGPVSYCLPYGRGLAAKLGAAKKARPTLRRRGAGGSGGGSGGGSVSVGGSGGTGSGTGVGAAAHNVGASASPDDGAASAVTGEPPVANVANVANVAAEFASGSVDLTADATLDPGFLVPGPAAAGWREVLLAGATGFLGTFLLREIADRTDAHVHCLVRAGDPERAAARLQAAMRGFGLWDEALAARVTAVPGDLERPGLGLSAERHAELAGRVDAVVHNGARVDHLEAYSRLRPANVEGTREVLRLATAVLSAGFQQRSHGIRWGRTATAAALAGKPVAGPEVDGPVLAAAVGYFRRTGFFAAPADSARIGGGR